MRYFVRRLANVISQHLVESVVTKRITSEHIPFVGNNLHNPPDYRQPGVYDFTDSDEAGLERTWQTFEQSYQAAARYPKFWVCQLHGAIVHPPHGIVSVGESIVRETIRDLKSLLSTFPGLDKNDGRRAMKDEAWALAIENLDADAVINEPSFQLGWGNAQNYFNWTLRYLAKIALWQRGASDRRLIVPAPRQPFINGSLEFFGVPQKAVRHVVCRTRIEHLTLSAPSALGRYELSPMLPSALRQHPRVEGLWGSDRRAVYVMRGKAKVRRVVNEAEVVRHLQDRGFRVLDPGRHPIAEQVRVFRNASLVLGAHGAGLSNIVYCRPETPVIEFVPEGYDQGVTSYRSLSDLFGLRHMQCFSKEIEPSRNGNRCNSQIEISIAGIERALNKAGI